MAIDELLLVRVRSVLSAKKIEWQEKRMFGGVCFMVNDKMCCDTHTGGLMVRTDPAESGVLLQRRGASPMTMTGRPMNGFLVIDSEGIDAELEYWIDKCLEFNPTARARKKRR